MCRKIFYSIIIIKKESGDFFKFENISWAPIDRDLINSEMLNNKELKWINEYHQSVHNKLSKFLSLEEQNWLQKVTMPI